MFLAIKEMRDSKLRFTLLTAIISLIAFVVFMISGLAGGLATGHKQAIEDWNASAMVLNSNANKIVNASTLIANQAKEIKAAKVAPVGFYSTSVSANKKKENISFFGTNKNDFVVPEITFGKKFNANYEVIVSQNMADKLKLKVGSEIKAGNLKHKLKVVGIFKKTQYSIQPVAYTNLPTFMALKYDNLTTDASKTLVNLFAVKGTNLTNVRLSKSATNPLEKMSVATFLTNLPGVAAESLSLNAMVYVLIIISAAVIAIFMYVLTLQKKSLFGILKAQGIPTSVIGKSIFVQSMIMGIIGVVIAFIIATIFGLTAPAAMPFAATYIQWFIYGIIIIAVATLGSLFSLPTVIKADPVTSIGG